MGTARRGMTPFVSFTEQFVRQVGQRAALPFLQRDVREQRIAFGLVDQVAQTVALRIQEWRVDLVNITR
jgi:hypothetical protein